MIQDGRVIVQFKGEPRVVQPLSNLERDNAIAEALIAIAEVTRMLSTLIAIIKPGEHT